MRRNKPIGIVRRLDHLGRLVIPKEIRDTMNIAEQTPVEIRASENGYIYIRKYPFSYVQKEEFQKHLDILGRLLQSRVIFCNTVRTLQQNHDQNEILIDKKISKEILEIIVKADDIFFPKEEIPVFQKGKETAAAILPIEQENAKYAIIVLGNKLPNEKEKSACCYAYQALKFQN